MGIKNTSNESVSLADALFPKVRQRVLSVLFGNPGPQFLRQRGDCTGAIRHGCGAARVGGPVCGGLADSDQARQSKTLPSQRQRTGVYRVALAGAQKHGIGGCIARIPT